MRRGHSLLDTYKDEAPPSFQNNFTAGLKTEFTGLNFPPNATTETYDCIYTMLGDVLRRPGFDFEKNYEYLKTTQTGAISSYRWLNAGGDGETQIYVLQIGSILYFYKSSNATVSAPLSTTLLASTVDLSQFAVDISSDFTITECQYSDGNGYLFVYSPFINPFYCSIANDVITPNKIDVQIRDFVGVVDNLAVTDRPGSLTNEHNYNLQNQGWTKGSLWSATVHANDGNSIYWDYDTVPLSKTGFGYTGAAPMLGDHTWIATPNLPITLGTNVDIKYSSVLYTYNIDAVSWTYVNVSGLAQGVVVSYDPSSGALTVNITVVTPTLVGAALEVTLLSAPNPATYVITAANTVDLIDTWYQQTGSYPSNADVWWDYKTAVTTTALVNGVSATVQANEFVPAVTLGTIPVATSPAPKGHFIVDAFNQQQTELSGVSGITSVITSSRPRTGAWFQGRVWYAGCDAVQPATGDQNFYTWTENLYFSQIVFTPDDFGHCYQTDDPTDENLFLLLPSDGGVVTIQGCGSIFKLFPIQNGMLVFAANGVWFITGSTGIGFTASDYTVTKISAVRSISSTSFVDVNGLPIFWNEEGIYAVEPAQQGLGLGVNPLTVGTIRSFYNQIPYQSKLYARGSYDPVNYVVQWLYNDGSNLANVADSGSPGEQPVPGSDTAVPGKYVFYFFDDCCHLWTSIDNGVTWVQSWTPVAPGQLGQQDTYGYGTMLNEWSDMQMAINDGDFNTIVGFDDAYNYLFSILGMNVEKGINGSWKLIAPDPYDDFNHLADSRPSYQQAFSGAYGDKAIITAPYYDNIYDSGSSSYLTTYPDTGGPNYPRISRDNGITWTSITSLPAGVVWSRACMSQNSTTMYIMPSNSSVSYSDKYIYKSIDSGVTWTQLSSGPTYHNISDDEDRFRIRCSQDGKTVATIAVDSNFWVSTDGGVTWANTTFSSILGTGHGRYADVSMSSDGKIILASYEQNISSGYWPAVFLSTDSGSTFTDISSRMQYPVSAKGPGISGASPTGCTACTVSPDGMAMAVTYVYTDTPHTVPSGLTGYLGYGVTSVDGGATWTLATMDMDPIASGSFLSLFTGIYAVPLMTPSQDVDDTPGQPEEPETLVSSGVYASLERSFNKVLNLNIFTKAWYPWTISEGSINGVTAPWVHDVKYVQNPGGENAPDGIFKYISSVADPTITGTTDFTFSECSDYTYVDWDYATETTGLNYNSYFITGYALDGQGLRKFQPGYVNVYSRNSVPNAYTIQGLWDYAISGASGKWTAKQVAHNVSRLFGMVHKRHKIRGQGYSLQLKFSSYENLPFDIIGWSIWTTMNMGV